MNDNERLTQAVNQSGFPLQIAIAYLVDKTSSKHGWKVLYSEHAWKNPNRDVEDGSKDESGFIDLVLECRRKDLVLIVECKRPQNTEWVFLIPPDEMKNRRVAKSWLNLYTKNLDHYESSEWLDKAIDPPSLQSRYCVVHGQDPKSIPMLERIGAVLIESTEGFASDDLRLRPRITRARAYFNVVVTTAKLVVCELEPEKISISDGTIENPTYREVPYIRFRKQLSTRRPSALTDWGKGVNEDMAGANENTLFVVNSENFVQFLSDFDADYKTEIDAANAAEAERNEQENGHLREQEEFLRDGE